jgi:hypothetical protein
MSTCGDPTVVEVEDGVSDKEEDLLFQSREPERNVFASQMTLSARENEVELNKSATEGAGVSSDEVVPPPLSRSNSTSSVSLKESEHSAETVIADAIGENGNTACTNEIESNAAEQSLAYEHSPTVSRQSVAVATSSTGSISVDLRGPRQTPYAAEIMSSAQTPEEENEASLCELILKKEQELEELKAKLRCRRTTNYSHYVCNTVDQPLAMNDTEKNTCTPQRKSSLDCTQGNSKSSVLSDTNVRPEHSVTPAYCPGMERAWEFDGADTAAGSPNISKVSDGREILPRSASRCEGLPQVSEAPILKNSTSTENSNECLTELPSKEIIEGGGGTK